MKVSASNSSGSGKGNRSKPSAWQAFLDALKPPENAADVMFGTVEPDDRLKHFAEAAGKGTASSYLNAAGYLLDEDESGEDAAQDAFGAASERAHSALFPADAENDASISPFFLIASNPLRWASPRGRGVRYASPRLPPPGEAVAAGD